MMMTDSSTKWWFLAALLVAPALFAQTEPGTYNLRGENTLRVSVHPGGYLALERFGRLRYGVLTDGGNTITLTLQPISDEDFKWLPFQRQTQVTYQVKYRAPTLMTLVNDAGEDFHWLISSSTPRNPVPDAIRAELAAEAERAATAEREAGVSVTRADFQGRWERDADDDYPLVLEFLESGGFRALTPTHASYGTFDVTGQAIRLSKFEATAPTLIEIRGRLTDDVFMAVENGRDIPYRRAGEPTLTDEDVRLARDAQATTPAGTAPDSPGAPQAPYGVWRANTSEGTLELELAPFGGARFGNLAADQMAHGYYTLGDDGVIALQLFGRERLQALPMPIRTLDPQRRLDIGQKDQPGGIDFRYHGPSQLSPEETQQRAQQLLGRQLQTVRRQMAEAKVALPNGKKPRTDADIQRALVGTWEWYSDEYGRSFWDFAPHGGMKGYISKSDDTYYLTYRVQQGQLLFTNLQGVDLEPLVIDSLTAGQILVFDPPERRTTDDVLRYRGPSTLTPQAMAVAKREAAARRVISERSALQAMQMQFQTQTMANQMIMQSHNQMINSVNNAFSQGAQLSRQSSRDIAESIGGTPPWEWRPIP